MPENLNESSEGTKLVVTIFILGTGAWVFVEGIRLAWKQPHTYDHKEDAS